MYTSSGPSADTTYDMTTRFFPQLLYLADGRDENCAISICISRQFESIGDPSQMRPGPTETDCPTLSLATSNFVAGRPVAYENQA